MVHGIVMLIASTSYLTQARIVQLHDVVTVDILPPTKPPRPSVRGASMARYIGSKYTVAKPTISADRTVVIEQVQVQPRGTHAAIHRPSSVQPQTVLEFSNKVVKLDSAIQPTIPASFRTTPIAYPSVLLRQLKLGRQTEKSYR